MKITNYKEGTILSVVYFLDKNKMGNIGIIRSVSIYNDVNTLNSKMEPHEPYKNQDFFVINCFNLIDDNELFNNEFVFNKKEVKIGDKVYVVTSVPIDDYGERILGVFTESPNKDTFYDTYRKHSPDCFDEEIYQIFEVVVS